MLDFVYPLQEFQRTRGVITLWFAILTALSLGIALMLTVNRVRRLTNPSGGWLKRQTASRLARSHRGA